MSSIDRPLSGDALRFTLAEEGARTRDPALLARSGRNARTLVKDGGLRVTLIVLAVGGGIPEHHADGPISVQVLEGSLRVQVGDVEHLLARGMLLSIPEGLPHSVSSPEGATFLLTVAWPTPPG